MDIQKVSDTYIANTYARFPLTLVRGEGALAWDEAGKRYIDLGSGIAVNAFGFSDAAWCAAVTEQLGKLQHTSNLYYTEPGARLAEMLCTRTGMKRVFFANSGAEANEGAIKAARRWSYLRWNDEEHSTIITLKNSFHGRTITTLSATGQAHYHHEFGPFTPGFVYADTEDPDSLEWLATSHNCCAVMIEIIQGEGGVIPLSDAFIQRLRETVEKHNLLLIVDEVQTGNGRTGKLYGYMHYDLQPDIVTTAKGLGGGLPLGAVLLGERVEDVLAPGTHGSTFGGNPVCCAGAVSILERIDDALLAEVAEKGAYIRSALTGAPGVLDIAGLGLMLGIATEKGAGEVIAAAREKGVLVLSAKDRVRLLPPLNIPMDLLKEAIEILKEAIA